jgi:hypothetical protein
VSVSGTVRVNAKVHYFQRSVGYVKSRVLVYDREARETEAIVGFVKAHQASHSVRVVCGLLKVFPSGFYAWEKRPISARERVDIALSDSHSRDSSSLAGDLRLADDPRRADDYGIRVGAWRG